MADMEMKLEPPAGLVGAARASWVQGEIRRRLAEQHLAEWQALARVVAALAGRLLSQPAPDALRALATREDALAVIALAYGQAQAEAIGGNWTAGEPTVKRQVSSGLDNGYELDPDHDSRVLAVLTRPKATMAEVSAVRQQVAAEYAEAAAVRERQRAHADDVLWTTRDGQVVRGGHGLPLGITAGSDGAPAQRSAVRQDWSAFADHQQAIPQAVADMGALEVALARQQAGPCVHADQAAAGHAYCTSCGARVGEAVSGS